MDQGFVTEYRHQLTTYLRLGVVAGASMKIVRRSNHDHEDQRSDQYFVAENITNSYLARIMCKALNDSDGPHGDNFFEVVPDSYVLPPKWEP